MAEIEGEFDQRFRGVADALARNLDEGVEVGASVAVAVDGEPVVDIWGGHKDLAKSEAWERDTIVNVFSTTKTMSALCALILADRGELELHAPVARYWPEFAQAGKDRIEVRHLLAHTSGLSGWEGSLSVQELADWDRCTGLLANKRRGGSREPPPAITRSPRDTSSASSSAVSPDAPLGSSSRRPSPLRSARTSTSACRPTQTRASRR